MATNGPRKGRGRVRKDNSRPPTPTPKGRNIRGQTGRSAGRSGSGQSSSGRPTSTSTWSAGSAGSAGATKKQPPKDAAQPQQPPRRRTRPTAGFTGRAAILALVLAALVVSYASSLNAWIDQRSRISALQQEVEHRSQRIDELKHEVERWHDPAYVEAQARKRFGWVMPGEIGYVVVDKDHKANRGANGDTDEHAHQPAWWKSMWQSVQTAGHPPEKKEPQHTKKQHEPAEHINPLDDDDD